MVFLTPETHFKNKVRAYLKKLDIYHVKYFGCAFSEKGVPDILACVNGTFVGLELKSEKGKASKLQEHHLKKIKESGGVSLLLYPKDFEKFKQICEGLMN